MANVTCLDCGQTRRHKARGLCRPCYQRRGNAGTLHERPLAEAAGQVPTVPQIPGISYRQLDHWVRLGYLKPEHATSGSGIRRLWSPDEAAVAQTMARLVNAGLTLDAAHTVARGRPQLAPGVHVLVEEAVTVDA